jgi:exodeoxyribonuclease V alpha subunit
LTGAERGGRGETGEPELVIEGEIERITFESGTSSFRVVKVAVAGRKDRLAVVGQFPPVAVGARVRARGRIVSDPKHGEQLQASSVTELAPSTLVGVERYLGSGIVKGIGEAYAKRIVARFGMDTLRVLDEDPARLAEVEGLGAKRIDAIAKGWREQRAIREVMVFLQAHGVSPALALRIFKRYGPHAINVVSREPYRLALDVWGVGFKTADRIAMELGTARDSPRRVEAGILQAVHDARDAGHVYLPTADLSERAAALLEVDLETSRPSIAAAIDVLALGGYVVPETAPEGRIVYGADMYGAEVRLARSLLELAAAPARPLPGAERAISEFERQAGVELAPEQRDAVNAAARASVLVVTGGPGVGKTTIVRAILATFDRAGIVVRLAAPTGRAAKRMSEATGRDASTLHRLLEFDPKTGAFKRNRGSPIEAGAIVVDEASMIDLAMADALVQAVNPGTRLVFVGDVDQLASVGPGAVLRDVIASRRIRCVRLTQIFRQARESLIVVNAHRINGGEPPLLPAAGDDRADFYVVERHDPEAAKKTIVELVTTRIPRRFGLDPVRDIQVLTPMHRGPCGSLALNEALQAALNPGGEERSLTIGTRAFRAGDKVMQLRNDYDRSVWNGDVGVVSAVDREESALTVRYDLGRETPYERGALDELTLAYACSVHKAQGSEYPAVVIPLLTTHFVMLTRNLLYTAVTRGKQLVVLVCDPRAVAIALAEDRKDQRRTRLAARLQAPMPSANGGSNDGGESPDG